ncbi:hypothetical protein BGX23_000232 [Mortierella sp. AD031]|nr:hypothetical protein BGX23_000232 [Mortierella sp. AD031]
MVNSGSLDVLPLSPCTNGSLGFGSQLLGDTLLKQVETPSTAELVEHTSTEVAEVAEKVRADTTTEHTEQEHTDKYHEQEIEKVDIETVDDEVESLTDKVAAASVSTSSEEDMEQEQDDEEEEHVEHNKTTTQDSEEETKPEVAMTPTPTPAPRPTSPSSSCPTVTVAEKLASGIPNRPILSGMPTPAQSRGLSAASLALKRNQAAENAAAALEAVAVEIPETDSISNRIRMFGGSALNRTEGLKKCNVRDMVQKFKDVDEKSHEDIAHVVKGHNNAEPKGVCAAYSLAMASRQPLRPTPRRKMSHELAENETRAGVAKMFGGVVVNSSSSSSSSSSSASASSSGHHYSGRNDDDRLGISQESLQSVRNAKGLFESLARNEPSGAQM